MKRSQAIELLAKTQLEKLSQEERAEQLEVMALEGWNDNNEWNNLPIEIQNEFEEGKPFENPNSAKYDQVLMIWLIDGLQSVTNEFIKNSLGEESVEGNPLKLNECPCCGCRTIGERGNYEICKVCWWEDDGQDNKNADEIFGGPNYGISLSRGRFNFIRFGLYDPNRQDLLKMKEPKTKYVKGREFEIIDGCVIEKMANWKSVKITNA